MPELTDAQKVLRNQTGLDMVVQLERIADGVQGNINLGLTGAAVGDLVRVAAIDANGKPTAWTHVPLCDIVTNQNLLDNWYFGPGVVNQRGISTATGSANYIVDRWKGYGYSAAELSIVSNGVQIVNASTGTEYLRQFLNTPLPAGKYTLSALVVSVTGGGDIGALSVRNRGNSVLPVPATPFTGTGLVTLTFDTNDLTSPADNVGFTCLSGKSVIVSAAKLEYGDTQTLAHQENGVWVLNEIADFGEELLKCQRYFQVFHTQALRPTYRQDYRPEMVKNTQSGVTDDNQPTLSTITIGGTTYYTASVEK